MNSPCRLFSLLVSALLLLQAPAPRAEQQAPGDAASQTPPQAEAAPAQTTTAQPAPAATAPAPLSAVPASQPADAFSRLKVVLPKEQLPPLRSVRLRNPQEAADRSRRGAIRVNIQTQPKGARVLYGGKLLGETPLTLSAPRGSTPFDVTIRRQGYMTLHTRIMRKKSTSYVFKLTPAKFHETAPAKRDE